MRKSILFLFFIFALFFSWNFPVDKNYFRCSFPYFNQIFYSQYKFESSFGESEITFPKKKILTLRECVYLAISNNLDLKIEKLNVENSVSNFFKAQSTFEPYLENKFYYKRNVTPSPSVFQGVGSSKTRETYYSSSFVKKFSTGALFNFTFETKKMDTNNIFFLINPAYNTTLSMFITQPLLKGGGFDVNKEGIYIARNNIEESKEKYRDRVEEVILNVVKNYYDILVYQKNVELAKKRVELARKTLNDVKIQVKAGVRPLVDEKKAEAEFYRQEENLIEVENNLKKLKSSFLTILFPFEDVEKYVDYFNLKDEKNDLSFPEYQEAKELALKNRGDLKAISLELKNSKLDLKVKKKNLKPNLDLTLGYFQYGLKGNVPDLSNFPFHINPGTQEALEKNYSGGISDSIGNAFRGKYNGFTVQFDFKIPIGNKYAKAEAVSSEINYHKSLYQLKDIRQKINLELRNIFRDIEKDKKKILMAERELEAAKEELRGEELKFKYEISTLRDLIDAQNKYISARLNYFSSRKEFEKNIFTLYRLTSTICDKFNVKFK